jgi:hypothetical protein
LLKDARFHNGEDIANNFVEAHLCTTVDCITLVRTLDHESEVSIVTYSHFNHREEMTMPDRKGPLWNQFEKDSTDYVIKCLYHSIRSIDEQIHGPQFCLTALSETSSRSHPLIYVSSDVEQCSRLGVEVALIDVKGIMTLDGTWSPGHLVIWSPGTSNFFLLLLVLLAFSVLCFFSLFLS